MLDTIKFPTEKHIMLLCPRCHKIVEGRRLSGDPPSSIYALFVCNDCRNGDDEDTIYYDKYGCVVNESTSTNS